jgi:hypothetical protein
VSDETVALDGKWPCCDHCRHGVHARRDGHFHACKWCQRPDGPATAVSDPDLHAACHRSLEQATADYAEAVWAARQQAGTDAAIGLSIRLLLDNQRWKTIRREKLQAIVDLHRGRAE